jgi:hypothetical protein
MSEKIILGLPLVNIVARKLVELVNIGYNIYKIYVVQLFPDAAKHIKIQLKIHLKMRKSGRRNQPFRIQQK